MKINFKFTASIVDEIEKAKGLPIENCIADTTIGNLALLIMKASVNENGVVGVSKNVAYNMIDEYRAEHDKDELMLDITEELVNSGFLSRALDVSKMREQMEKRKTKANEQLENI